MVSCVSLLSVVALAAVASAVPAGHMCVCPLLFAPVCASNGQVFDNPCMVKCYNRENNSNLKIVHDGSCGELFPVINPNEVAVASADLCPCTREYMPVCGSDHHTYSNRCLLKCAAKKNHSLKMLHDGRCELPLANFKLNWPKVHEIPDDVEVEDISHLDWMVADNNCICTREYMPVCGSDKQTYSNKCMLRCAMKKDKSLKMVHDGDCDFSLNNFKLNWPKVHEIPDETDVDDLPDFGMMAADDSCFCTFEYMPVCGSDMQTYPNKCTLRCAMKKDKSLKMVHAGDCNPMNNFKLNWPKVHEIPDETDVDDLPDFGMMAADDYCVCTKEYSPVCGSNMHTYANKCMLECAMKKDKSLKMMYPMVCIILP